MQRTSDSEALKAQAYEASRANRLSDAADRFQQYLQQKPQDTRAALDYAGVLLQLNRPADAAKVLESIHQQQPENESAYFKLGETLVQLQRYAQAESIFASLEKSKNQDIATAATAALRNVRKEIAREYKTKTERRIYELAAEFKHREVIDLITELEKHSPLTFSMQMQRLYAMQALGMYAPALREADKMSEAYPQAPDLALLRADLLTQLGRRPEAEAIWRRMQRERVGTNPGLIATERLKGGTQPGASEADLVFSLASRQTISGGPGRN